MNNPPITIKLDTTFMDEGVINLFEDITVLSPQPQKYSWGVCLVNNQVRLGRLHGSSQMIGECFVEYKWLCNLWGVKRITHRERSDAMLLSILDDELSKLTPLQ